MQNPTVTFDADATKSIGNAVYAKAGQMMEGTVYIQGTWGGGTAALVISRDASTWIPVKDQTGSAIQFTANGAVNYRVAPTNITASNGLPLLGITLSGSTAPALTVYHDDQR